MFNLGRNKHALLGIDISSTSIKLVELARTGSYSSGMYRVESFALEPLPVGAVVEKKIADAEVVGGAIQKALQRSRSKTRQAAVAVPASAAITKSIAMSAELSESEMEAQIQLEADQYIPYPLEEVNLDFDILGPSAVSSGMVDVLLAASRRENVDDRVAALEFAGLTAEVVDIETYAMENACALQLANIDDALEAKIIAVADVGATTTTLHVLHGGAIVYTREQNFGGNQLLSDLQRRYDLSVEEALAGLNQPAAAQPNLLAKGGLPENAETEVVGPFKEALAQQVSRALQFFYSASSFGRTDQLILAGGAARLLNIADLVEQRLGFPVQVANPFEDMALARGVDRDGLERAAPGMMIAVGLALRGFN
ncbi:type IV pilus assembly protein PilM [Thiorhodovibrio frisius]|uniref:Type IV pilus assembly protein PilM n=1 Tax=Thiorhodovibrio frisius TaxID=631362 RepID=H8YY18_9GAMM|nr:type IV pilus assembly protein PilM [Thiorhodovibrio frisius]EIC23344.1 type IV pilus assembly protein PilM [Thiorhodovibrio frisius]WPL23576.1 ethanolamine utilization protein EutJ [Thiorhodovibrio frisius]